MRRLSSEGNGVISVTYGYDAANNRTSMNVGGVVTTYAYDANNRLLSESKAGTVKSYTYDANGSQLTGDGATYTYNARGQLASYSKDGVTASYTYLPTGLRKSKTVGGTTTTFVWDGQNMVYEYSGTNATGGKAYYYGLTLISQGNAAYYLYNGHGDVVQLVTSTGTLGRSYAYDAFGNEVNAVSGDTNAFRYAGQYYDTETGTYYLRARYYNPSIGRFTQQDGWQFADPSDPLSLNLYTYCWNNPIIYFDPTGEAPWWALMYPGEIHSAVQKKYMEILPLEKEVYVMKYDRDVFLGMGKIDLYDKAANKAWEVKPQGYSIELATTQLSYYINGLNHGKEENLATKGSHIESVAFRYRDFYVTAAYVERGIIYYDFDFIPRPDEVNVLQPFPFTSKNKRESIKAMPVPIRERAIEINIPFSPPTGDRTIGGRIYSWINEAAMWFRQIWGG